MFITLYLHMKFRVSIFHGSKVTEGDGPMDRPTDRRTDGPTDGRTKWIVEIPAESKNHVKFFGIPIFFTKNGLKVVTMNIFMLF